MAISFVGSDFDSENTNSLSISWPATEADDVAVLFWRYRETPTDPSGFTSLGTADDGNDFHRAYYRVCDGSESGSVTLNQSAFHRNQAVLLVYRGVDPSGPINDSAFSSSSSNPPAVTTTVDDTAIVISASSRNGSVETYTYPAGYTERHTVGTSGGGASTLGVADSITTRSAGTENPDAISTSTSNDMSWTIALAPGDGEPPEPPSGIHITSHSTQVGTGSSQSISKPSDTVEGDVMLMFHSCEWDDASSMTAPSGGATWNQLGSTLSGGNQDGHTKVWWKVAGASEPSSYSYSQGSITTHNAVMMTIRGSDGTEPLINTTIVTDSNAPDIDTPSITPEHIDNFEVRWAAAMFSSSTSTSLTIPVGFTSVASLDDANYVFSECFTRKSGSTSATGVHTVDSNVSLDDKHGLTVNFTPESTGENFNETVTALSSDASLGTPSAAAAADSSASVLDATTSLDAEGTAQASASSDTVAAAVALDATGDVDATVAAGDLSTNVSVAATGTKQVDTASDALSAVASLGAVGVTDASASVSLDTAASTEASGTVEASASSSLDTDVSLTTAGTRQTEASSDDLATSASLDTEGTAEASASSSLDTDVSLTTVGVRGTDTSSEGLASSTSLDGDGTAEASASVVSLDAEASVDAAGTAAASGTASLDSTATVDVTGSKQTEASSATLSSSVATDAVGTVDASSLSSDLSSTTTVSAAGTAAANAAAPLNLTMSLVDASSVVDLVTDTPGLTTSTSTTADVEGDGTGQTPGLLSTVSFTAMGTASATSDGSLDVTVTFPDSDAGAGFFEAVSVLSGSLDVTATGSLGASTDTPGLATSTSTDSQEFIETVSAANLLDAMLQFQDALASGGEGVSATGFSLTFDLGPTEEVFSLTGETVFSTTVDLDSESAASVHETTDPLSADTAFPGAFTLGGNSVSADPLTVSVTLSSTGSANFPGDAVSFSTLLELESATGTASVSASSQLQVEATFGSVTIYIDPLELLLRFSVTETEIPELATDTEIDFLGLDTHLGDTSISTDLPFEELTTDLGDAATLTVVPDPGVDTDYGDVNVETGIDDPLTETELPGVGIETSVIGDL